MRIITQVNHPKQLAEAEPNYFEYNKNTKTLRVLTDRFTFKWLLSYHASIELRNTFCPTTECFELSVEELIQVIFIQND